MDNSKLIEKLNEILRWEWTGVAQYFQASFVVSGPWREVYTKMFQASAEESLGHARLIADKIVAYGGVPTIERDDVKQSNDLTEMLEHALAFESGAVKHYNEALKLADGKDRALVVLLEDILLQEQDGVDEVSKLLHGQAAAAAKGKTTSKAG